MPKHRRTAKQSQPRPADSGAPAVPFAELAFDDAITVHAKGLRALAIFAQSLADNFERLAARRGAHRGRAGGRPGADARDDGPAAGSKKGGR